jgi:hypothetical protein
MSEPQKDKYAIGLPVKGLKTLPSTRKSLAMGSLILGAVLLITPAIAFAQTGTTYVNASGENATLNVTNNQDGAYYTVAAAGACLGSYAINGVAYNIAGSSTNQNVINGCLSIPFVSDKSLPESQTLYIFSVGGFIEGSSGQGIYTEYLQGYGAQTVPAYYYPGNSTLQYGLNGKQETLYSYLSSLHSVYMFTGTGSYDEVTLFGGLTADQFSITTPGANTVVNINAGLGNSTYNIVVGALGTVNINDLNSAGAYNYYNIVY